MPESKIQLLDLGSMHIAMGAECRDSFEHSLHFPRTVLIFIDSGQLHLRGPGREVVVAADSFFLLRKNAIVPAFKTWTEEEGFFRMAAFVFEPEFVRETLQRIPYPEGPRTELRDYLVLASHPALEGLFRSLEPYFSSKLEIDRSQVLLKTQEALVSLARLDVNVHRFLQPDTPGGSAELNSFMAEHLTDNLGLDELARKSGRSLSTFHRDFKMQFGRSPHRWIKEQRLKLAHQILTQTDRTASEIFLDLGFEDLSHFSRSFKEYFGINPSETVSRPQLTQISK
jgi:AraC family transcriptional regulator, exoenzyme S synthesis regulatory protein ExsA